MPPIREARPCATSKEALIRLRRSPAEYACCDKPDNDSYERVLGCGVFYTCPHRKGGAEHREGAIAGNGGPHYKGVRIYRMNDSGPGVREVIVPCYGLVPLRTEIEDNGGIVEIIAEEGQWLEHSRGSVFVPADPLKGETVGHYEDRDDMRVQVPEHPRDETYAGLRTMATIEKMKESDARKKREQLKRHFQGEPLKEEPEGGAEQAAAPVAAPAAVAERAQEHRERKQGGGKGPSVSSELG